MYDHVTWTCAIGMILSGQIFQKSRSLFKVRGSKGVRCSKLRSENRKYKALPHKILSRFRTGAWHLHTPGNE
jgi:hypothetical protein